jgi:hypothetical protein
MEKPPTLETFFQQFKNCPAFVEPRSSLTCSQGRNIIFQLPVALKYHS